MSTVYHCDRCHKTSTDRHEIRNEEVPYLTREYRHRTNEEETLSKRIDLCKECLKQLEDFMKPLPKHEK